MEKATETNAGAIAPQEEVKILPPTEEDLEAKVKALEEEKARLTEESANYKVAYLKEKSKKREESFEDETEEERYRRIAREELANSRIADIAREQDAIIRQALKENKELKLAQLNKTGTPPAIMGAHSESMEVKDTLVTPSQLADFKARGWSEKDIERYKKNLQRYGGR